jgi:hypothetical protein
MTIHHIIHFDKEHQNDVIEKLNFIISKLNTIMANEQQFKDALARIEKATTDAGTAATAIQARIDALTEAIKNAGLPSETEDALLAQLEGTAPNLEALAAALTAMGSPTDPIPVPVPDPVEPI